MVLARTSWVLHIFCDSWTQVEECDWFCCLAWKLLSYCVSWLVISNRQNHSVNSIFVSGLNLHFRIFGPHWGDKVKNSGHDKGVGVLEVGKHHFDVLTFRLWKTPMWTTDRTHDLTWTWLAISCTFYRHGFGGEEVGRCSLASDNILPSIGLKVLKKGCKLETGVYRKPRNAGLLLHQRQNHFDKRYKKSQAQSTNGNAVHRVVLPFKDQS